MDGMTKQFQDAMAQFAEIAAAVPGYVMDHFRALGEAAAEVNREINEVQALGMSLLEYRISQEYSGLLDADKDGEQNDGYTISDQ